MMPKRSPTAVDRLGRVMVELTRRPEVRTCDPSGLLDQIPDQHLVDMACYHRLPGVVYRSLSDLGVASEAAMVLREYYQMASVGHGRCLNDLEAIVDTLGPLDHPWLVVKGPVLVELGYRDPGARLYEDLDLLVTPSDLTLTLSCIEADGGQLGDLNWPMMTRLGRAELPMVLPAGMVADLHWHLLVTPAIRSRFRFPLEEFLERRRVVTIGRAEVSDRKSVV